MGKTLLKMGLALVVVLVAVPVVTYRTVRPCEMLRKELVRDTERTLEAARDSLRQVTGALGDRAREVATVVNAGFEATLGVATAAAEAKVRQMSAGECASELIDNKLRRDRR